MRAEKGLVRVIARLFSSEVWHGVLDCSDLTEELNKKLDRADRLCPFDDVVEWAKVKFVDKADWLKSTIAGNRWNLSRPLKFISQQVDRDLKCS